MENNDRQQYSDYGEIEEDILGGQSDRKTVSDTGSSDWGEGLLNWDIPQEEQQGSVESGYDAGIEMLSDDAGKADSKVDENEIEMPPMYVGKASAAGQEPFIGTPRLVSEDEHLRKLNEHNQTQVSEWNSNGELEARYKELLTNSGEYSPDQVDQIVERLHTGLTAPTQVMNEMTEMLTQRDLRDERNAELEARYGDPVDPYHSKEAFGSEEDLRTYYKELYKTVNQTDEEPDMEGLDTYDKLKTGVYELWEQNDTAFDKAFGAFEGRLEARIREQFKEKFGYDLGDDVDWREYAKYLNGTEDSDTDAQTGTTPKDSGQADSKVGENEIEMPPMYAGKAGAAGQPDSKIGRAHV
jgi:hypothetical protein